MPSIRILPENTPLTRTETANIMGVEEKIKVAPIVAKGASLQIKTTGQDDDGKEAIIKETVPLTEQAYIDAFAKHSPDENVRVCFHIQWKTKAMDGDVLEVKGFISPSVLSASDTTYSLCDLFGLNSEIEKHIDVDVENDDSFAGLMEEPEVDESNAFDSLDFEDFGDEVENQSTPHKKLAQRIYKLHCAINQEAAKKSPDVIFKGRVIANAVMRAYQVDLNHVEILKRR
ncbi:MAG: hypothetical protein F6K50_02615 [Moorea sp. SIO3I7]|nr:hypothetical protein [Moorena sp. SIO3I7]